MQKNEKKDLRNPDLYRCDLIYIESIERLAGQKCPIKTLELPTGDEEKDNENFIMTIRSASENSGFIKGYEHAISIVKELMGESINDYEQKIIGEVFNKLIEC